MEPSPSSTGQRAHHSPSSDQKFQHTALATCLAMAFSATTAFSVQAQNVINGDVTPTTLPNSTSTISSDFLIGNTANGSVVSDQTVINIDGNAVHSIRLGVSAGTKGTLELTNGSHLEGRFMTSVGTSGTGELKVLSGSKFITSYDVSTPLTFRIGEQAGSNGSVLISGQSSSFTAANAVEVGRNGTGSLSVEDGASYEASQTILGAYSGTGDLTVTGSGTSYKTTTGTYVMSGTLTVSDGASFEPTSLSISGGTLPALATITGAGTTVTTSETLIGMSGQGSLTVADEASYTTNIFTFIGYSNTGSGELIVTDAGTTYTAVKDVSVGYRGDGTLTVKNGASFEALGTTAIAADQASGTLTVTGAGSSFTGNGEITIGYRTVGTMIVEDGASVTSNNRTLVGALPTSNGTLTVTGQGSTYNSAYKTHIGERGIGVIKVESGATFISRGPTELGIDEFSTTGTGNGSLIVTGSGSSFTAKSGLVVGNNGAGNVTVENRGTLINDAGTTIALKSGSSGSLTVTGPGSTLTSTDVNVGAASAGILNIHNGGLLATNQVTLGSLAGGSGTLNITGTAANRGVLRATKISAGAGAYTINANGGVLQFTSGGDVMSGITTMNVGNEGVVFDVMGNDVTIDTNMINTGAAQTVGVIKQGTGMLTLRGQTSTNTGTNYVHAGHLIADFASSPTSLTPSTVLGTGSVVVGGAGAPAIFSVTRNLQLPNHVDVHAQGRLTGYGHVGSATIHSGGTISPGGRMQEFDTLTIDGDLTMHSGSTYEIDFGARSDLLIVKGKANLSGLLLDVEINNTFDESKIYTVLIAEGGVIGELDEARAANFAYLSLVPRYDVQNIVYLGLNRNNQGFGELPSLTPNQSATGRGIQGMGDRSNPIYRHTLGLRTNEVAAFFDSVSGEIHATLQHALLGNSQYLADSNLGALRNSLLGNKTHCSMSDPTTGLKAEQQRVCQGPGWVQIDGDWRQQSGDGNAASSNTSTYGLMLGFDEEIAQSGWRLGGAFGYSRASVKVSDRNSSADIDSYSVSIYGGKSFVHGRNKLNVLGGLAYTQHDISTQRNVRAFSQQLDSNYIGRSYQAFAEVSYAIPWNETLTIEPFVGVSVNNMQVGAFREQGGFVGVNANDAGVQTRTSSTVGVRTWSDFVVNGTDVQVNAMLGWKHAWGQFDVTRNMAFNVGSPEYMIFAVPMKVNTAVVGLGAQVEVGRTSWLELRYQGEFGQGFVDQTAMLNLRMAF